MPHAAKRRPQALRAEESARTSDCRQPVKSAPGKAALDSAAEHLQALRREAERAGWSLAGTPAKEVRAAAVATQEAAGELEQQPALVGKLYGSSDTCTAVVQLIATAVRDVGGAPDDSGSSSSNGDVCSPALLSLLQALRRLVDPNSCNSEAVDLPWTAAAVRVRLSMALLRGGVLPAAGRLLHSSMRWLRGNSGGGASTSGAAASASPAAAAPVASATSAVAARVALAVDSAMAVLVCVSGGVLLPPKAAPASLVCEAHAALVRSLHASSMLEHLCRLRLEVQALLVGRLGGAAGAALRDGLGKADEMMLDVLPRLFHESRTNPAEGPTCAAPMRGGGGSLPHEQRLQLQAIVASPSVQLYVLWALAARQSARAGRLLYGTPCWLVPLSSVGYQRPVAVAAALATAAMWAVQQEAAGGAGGSPPRMCITPAQLARLLCTTLTKVNADECSLKAFTTISDDGTRRAFEQTALLCYRLLRRPRSASAARGLAPCERVKLLRAVWEVVVTAVCLPPLEGVVRIGAYLLRLEDAAAGGVAPSRGRAAEQRGAGAGSALPRVLAPPPRGPALSLRCALDAGLLRAVEAHVRVHGCAVAGKGEVDALRVSLLLLRPGVWPAVLAYANVREVASLAVTLGKVFVMSDLEAKNTWRTVLLGLLEQTAAALTAGGTQDGGSSGAAAAAAAGAGGSGGSGLACAARSCELLRLNAAVWRSTSDVGSSSATWGPPDLALIARLGGCPPAGSPAAQQQRTLTTLLLAEWLPVLTTHQRPGALPCRPTLAFPALPSSRGPFPTSVAAECTLTLAHWLGVVARAAARGSWSYAGARAGQSWEQLLSDGARAGATVLTWAAQLLLRGSGFGAHEGLAPLLPTCLDLLELLVCVEPFAIVGRMLATPLPGGARSTVGDLLIGTMGAAELHRQGRGPLLAALKQLEVAALLGGNTPILPLPESLGVHLRSPPAGLGPLPAPCDVEVLLPRRSHPASGASGKAAKSTRRRR